MSPISPPVQAVLDLFADPLRDLRFADVDAGTLGELAASALAAAEVVAAAEAELVRARGVLQDQQDRLLAHAQRALAYARVYAETDPALMATLDEIALPRAGRRSRAEGETLVLQPVTAPRSKRSAGVAGDAVTGGSRKPRALSREPEPHDAVVELDVIAAG